MTRNYHVGALFAAFGIGALIGAGAVALYTPNTGRGLRKKIARQGIKLKERAISGVEQFPTRTGKVLSKFSKRAKETASELIDRGMAEAEDLKSNIEEEAKSKAAQMR